MKGFENLHLQFITKEYLRSQFPFETGISCNMPNAKKSYPTCTYIWGSASNEEHKRTKARLAPEGNKLQIIYPQTSRAEVFQR